MCTGPCRTQPLQCLAMLTGCLNPVTAVNATEWTTGWSLRALWCALNRLLWRAAFSAQWKATGCGNWAPPSTLSPSSYWTWVSFSRSWSAVALCPAPGPSPAWLEPSAFPPPLASHCSVDGQAALAGPMRSCFPGFPEERKVLLSHHSHRGTSLGESSG